MLRCLLILLLATSSISLYAQKITVAAASSLRGPLEQIVIEFEKSTGIKSDLVFASSGKLFTQIEQGAPYQVFLSADGDYATELSKKMKLDQPQPFCMGYLGLWTSTPFQSNRFKSFDQFSRIALPNPEFAPYGKLAKVYLENEGLFHTLSNKLVFGSNVSQVNLYIKAESVDVVFSSWSSQYQLNQTGYWTKLDEYQVLNYALSIKGNSTPSSDRFLAYLHQEKAQEILKSFGYQIPCLE